MLNNSYSTIGDELFEDSRESSLDDLFKLALIGQQTSRLIHDLANPLTAALITLETAKTTAEPETIEIMRCIKLMSRYIHSFRSQLNGNVQKNRFDIRSNTYQVIQAMLPLARQHDVAIQMSRLPSAMLYGDPIIYQRILSNLIVNGIESYDQCQNKNNKYVKIGLSTSSGMLRIKVSDHGQGISESDMPRLFEQFYSTKKTSLNGMGLGLNQVKQYVEEEFFGSIRVSSSLKHGTCFDIELRLMPTKISN